MRDWYRAWMGGESRRGAGGVGREGGREGGTRVIWVGTAQWLSRGGARSEPQSAVQGFLSGLYAWCGGEAERDVYHSYSIPPTPSHTWQDSSESSVRGGPNEMREEMSGWAAACGDSDNADGPPEDGLP